MWRRGLNLAVCAIAIFGASGWLAGYARAVLPFAADGLQDGDFTFLAYPNIKFYTEAEPQTGQMSGVKIDFFSVVDGPTGVIFARTYIPCWIISIAAVVVLVFAFLGIRSCFPFYWSFSACGRIAKMSATARSLLARLSSSGS